MLEDISPTVILTTVGQFIGACILLFWIVGFGWVLYILGPIVVQSYRERREFRKLTKTIEECRNDFSS